MFKVDPTPLLLNLIQKYTDARCNDSWPTSCSLHPQCNAVPGHGFVLDKYRCQCKRGFYQHRQVALNGFTSKSCYTCKLSQNTRTRAAKQVCTLMTALLVSVLFLSVLRVGHGSRSWTPGHARGLSAMPGRLPVLSGRLTLPGTGGRRPPSGRRRLPGSVCPAERGGRGLGLPFPPQQGQSDDVQMVRAGLQNWLIDLICTFVSENQGVWIDSAGGDRVGRRAPLPARTFLIYCNYYSY